MRDVCVLRVERHPVAATDLALSVADAQLRALEAPSRALRPSARDEV